jgi:hypothetical protein
MVVLGGYVPSAAGGISVVKVVTPPHCDNTLNQLTIPKNNITNFFIDFIFYNVL